MMDRVAVVLAAVRGTKLVTFEFEHPHTTVTTLDIDGAGIPAFCESFAKAGLQPGDLCAFKVQDATKDYAVLRVIPAPNLTA